MVALKPRQYVAAPTFTPLPYGLLTALSTEIRQPSDEHWTGGVTWESICTDTVGLTYDECLVVSGVGGSLPEPPSKSATASFDPRGALPFTVYFEIDCSAPGFYDRVDEAITFATAIAETRAVEQALWTGVSAPNVASVYPHLAADAEVNDENMTLQTAAVVVSGSGIVGALGAVEQSLAQCYGGVGVIHAPRGLAPAFADAHLLEREGPRYRTPNGNVIVFGTGYPGTGPDGTGTNWIYGTGMPFIYRNELTVFQPRESINRETNTVLALAERTYVIGWDCCHVAAQVG